MSDPEALQARIEELESQMAFQDELHAQLNEVVARQDRDLEVLKTRVEALALKIRDLGDAMPAAGGDPGDEIPPHY